VPNEWNVLSVFFLTTGHGWRIIELHGMSGFNGMESRSCFDSYGSPARAGTGVRCRCLVGQR